MDTSYQMVSDPERFVQAIIAMLAEDEFDAALVQFTTNADPFAERLAHTWSLVLNAVDVPIYVSRFGGTKLAPEGDQGIRGGRHPGPRRAGPCHPGDRRRDDGARRRSTSTPMRRPNFAQLCELVMGPDRRRSGPVDFTFTTEQKACAGCRPRPSRRNSSHQGVHLGRVSVGERQDARAQRDSQASPSQ